MEPTRSPRATLPDLIEVLLNRGVYLHLDLIISVADIPLIGVNLKATVAGMETMLQYGMMRGWDEKTRRWVEGSQRSEALLDDGESLTLRMRGEHLWEHPGTSAPSTWRPGEVLLTSHRLLLHRRDPEEVLVELRLVDLAEARTLAWEDGRDVVLVVDGDGGQTLLSAADPHALLDALRGGRAPGTTSDDAAGSEAHGAAFSEDDEAETTGPMWFSEGMAGRSVWRRGEARLDADGELTWSAGKASRAALRALPGEVLGVEIRAGGSPAAEGEVIVLRTPDHEVLLAADDPEEWLIRLGRAGWPIEVDDLGPDDTDLETVGVRDHGAARR